VTGLQEILLIVLLILAVLFLPRLLGGGTKKASGKNRIAISGWARLAIVFSVIWVLVWATYLKPWNGELLSFTLFGLCPPILAWGAFWIIAGFRKNQDV
jgi:hypothetical protein